MPFAIFFVLLVGLGAVMLTLSSVLGPKRGGRTKRGQTSWIFPTFLVSVVVIGLALTAFSRQQRQPDTSHPRVGSDHWHSAIGFDICASLLAFLVLKPLVRRAIAATPTLAPLADSVPAG